MVLAFHLYQGMLIIDLFIYLKKQNLNFGSYFRSPMLPGSSEHKDMAEIEEPLGTSPPLELRRSASGPRPTIAVPHSLQSPQDRATGIFKF